MTHASTLTLETDVAAKHSLAETAYAHIKASIFDFELLPGDRFSETEIAERLKMSRTPVRDALYRLEQERYLQVHCAWAGAYDRMTFAGSKPFTICG
jgi:DNA-binding GntR family transcriptional regulator